MDFQEKLKDIIRRAHHGEPPPRRYAPNKGRLYSLFKIEGGNRRGVAFGMTEREARILSHVLRRKLERTAEPDGTGKNLFEIRPETEIKEEE